MGINFKQIKYARVGDIIYPAYNGTNGFLQTSRWDVVTKVNKKNKIMDRRYIWDVATVKAIEIIREFPECIELH